MGAPLKVTGPVGPDATYQPTVRIAFKGKDQQYLFSLRKIAREAFDTDATGFGRQVLIDFVKEYRDNPENSRFRRVRQEMLALEGVERKAGPAPAVVKAKGKSK